MDDGIFLGYSLTSHAYRVYNKKLMTVEEFVHVVFDKTNHAELESMKNYTKEDDQNITLQKLQSCPKKQPLILRNNRLKFCNKVIFPKNGGFLEIFLWRILLGRLIREFLLESLSLITANIWLLCVTLNLNL